MSDDRQNEPHFLGDGVDGAAADRAAGTAPRTVGSVPHGAALSVLWWVEDEGENENEEGAG